MFILGYVIISLKRRVLYVELEKKFKFWPSIIWNFSLFLASLVKKLSYM